MFRASFQSIVIVGVMSLGITLTGTHVLNPKWFRGFESLGRDIRGAVSCIRSSIDGIVASAPIAPCAGPTYVLIAAQGEVLGLDKDGYVASCDTASARCDLPVLTGFLPATKALGDNISSAEVVVGLAIVRAFDEKPEMMKMLSEVNLENLNDPRVILRGGVTVDFGGGDYKRKVEKLNQVLLHLKRLNASPKTVDLRFARQVVVKCNEPHRDIEKEV